ncbi:MAG TPA: hypothetical protein VD884_19050 [Ohtaekwangia sp.]|nr:hypothetical protein [Ohtaekwangia sp.]
MRLKPTPHLSIEDSDAEVELLIEKIKNARSEPLPFFVEKETYDWFIIHAEITRKEEPIDGTLYMIQHFGKVGDTGYFAYILEDFLKNRHDLDLLIKLFDGHIIRAKQNGETGNFHSQCADMIKGLRLGTSLAELMKKGILHTPPPNLN